MKKQAVTAAGVLAAFIGIAGIGLTAAGESQAGRTDVLEALLDEVRGLRAAIEQMAAAGPRVQLALGRLQIQEQRINTLLRRQEDVASRIQSQEQQASMIRQGLADREAELTIATPAQERAEIEKEVPRLKALLDQFSQTIGQLRAEEAQIATSISLEQNRWIEINAQLEALERELGGTRRR